MYVMGIDLGTQGIRALICDLEGNVQSEAQQGFAATDVRSQAPGVFEQDTSHWREPTLDVIADCVAQLVAADKEPEEIAALSVISTSGTLCLVDDAGMCVGPAMMYSDARPAEVADEVQAAGADVAAKLGTRFSSSYALSKLRWLQRHQPERLDAARWFISPTDLLIGWLSGEWGTSDWTNMLKTGYDVVDLHWPAFIEDALGLPQAKLPDVVAPGTPLGTVKPAIARRTGLPLRTLVVAGATDGNASQLASGAVSPGEWNSTLGTTLVLKGVTDVLLRDPLGRVYCHRHPDGHWLPGGASSTGGDCLALRFDAAQLDELNEAANAKSPTDIIVYPLVRRGERFPFQCPDAEGFIIGEAPDIETLYAAHLEGLAYVERMAYNVVMDLGGTVGDTVCVAGGGTNSRSGLQIRADALGKRLRVPEITAGAMGAAILAARGCAYPTVTAAAQAMVRYRETVEPRAALREAYDVRYQRFVDACRSRGYVS